VERGNKVITGVGFGLAAVGVAGLFSLATGDRIEWWWWTAAAALVFAGLVLMLWEQWPSIRLRSGGPADEPSHQPKRLQEVMSKILEALEEQNELTRQQLQARTDIAPEVIERAVEGLKATGRIRLRSTARGQVIQAIGLATSPPEDWDKDGWEGSYLWAPEGGPNVVLLLTPPADVREDSTLVCEVQDPQGVTVEASSPGMPGSLVVQGVPSTDYRFSYPISFLPKGQRPKHLPAGWFTACWYTTYGRAGRELLSMKSFQVGKNGEIPMPPMDSDGPS